MLVGLDGWLDLFPEMYVKLKPVNVKEKIILPGAFLIAA